jgi:hypothetical protein
MNNIGREIVNLSVRRGYFSMRYAKLVRLL